ncbi:MAG: class I SAM-dependent methyltransferase [Pyrinomonadaceae bacterium]
MTSTAITPEMDVLKSRLRDTWSDGDFGEIAKALEAGAEDFVLRLDLKPDMRVLDVACGTGNLAIPAARTGANVAGVDIAPNLIATAIERARDTNVECRFEVGDAEDLPYPTESFDVVMTMFGAMFAPRPAVTAVELIRVCKPGGLIVMANWTPEGPTGQMFRISAKHVPPPPGMPSPLLWGTEDVVRERFAREEIGDLQMHRRRIIFAFPLSPIEVVEHFREFFGPTKKAFDSLDAQGKEALRHDLEHFWMENNIATDDSTLVESEYLEVRAIRA